MNKNADSVAVTQFYSKLLHNFLANPDSCNIIAKPPQGALSDGELKALCEQCLRDCIYSHVQLGRLDLSGSLGVIQASIQLVDLGQCLPNLPFVLLEDMFECITVSECEAAFSFLENNIDIWRKDNMLSAGKNYLLRMCNNLLRRLSTLRNTIFCGRIQLFLAQLLPLDEKSALNIMGAFNLDNVTIFASDPTVNEETFASLINSSATETGSSMDTSDSNAAAENAIDYALYKSFWSLQDYFRSPNQCYDRQKWTKFTGNVTAVLKVFTQHKLENVAMSNEVGGTTEDEVYFPKNLTSEKLFDLQLGDVNFRRHVLVQFLVLFQYLLMKDVKFKPASCQLPPDDMVLWVNSTQEKVYKLLEESPPNGELLVKTLKHILTRELIWNSWKNAGCPSYVKTPAGSDKDSSDSPGVQTTKSRTRRVYIGDSFPSVREDGGPPPKRINLGNKELTTLWNIEPDNLKACRAENRRIFPEVKDFFQEAAEQLEPGSGVEEEYMLVLKPNFQWCALRLLARRSTLFFQPNPQLKTVPDFLKAMIEKTYNTKLAPPTTKADLALADKTSVTNGSLTPNRTGVETEKQTNNSVEEGEESANNGLNNENNEEGVVTDSRPPTEGEMAAIAKAIPTDNLKDLAVQLDFKDEEIDQLMKESNWCTSMLRQWVEREGEDASVSNLVQSLLDVEMPQIVFRVYPKLLPAQYRHKALENLEPTETSAETDEPMVVS